MKYNRGKKSLKAPFSIYLDLESLLKKKESHRKNSFEKSYTEKKLGMSLQAVQFLQDVYLMKKKINLIITGEKIVLTNCVKG